MATPLFSQHQHGAVSESLVEFKAGRLFRDGETNWVRPDPRAGLCFVKKEDDELLRFCWKERSSNALVEEELIVFPGDVSLEKVTQSSGRVYVLKFKSSSQRLFFWLQEADATRDAQLINSVNDVLGGDDDFSMGDDDVRELLLESHGSHVSDVLSHNEQGALARESSSLSHDSLPSAQVGGSHNDTTPGMRRAAGLGPSQLSSLRQMLADIQVPSNYSSQTSVHLGDVLTPANLRSVLEDARLREALFPTLPDHVPRSQRALDQVIRGPQFQQALESLSYVLESGQMGPLVTQLGLAPEAGSSVAAFLKAIQEQLEREKAEDEDHAME
ncbi:hypothetical protein IWW49_003517 [Coemansia sp. RSA 1797]|nr:hypothetical protein IWW35_003453 [Coemansia sp. RSA 1878]KAJ2587357.1 hypothetical protein IWW49_003517 [Coemansia sp. RSA 1797]